MYGVWKLAMTLITIPIIIPNESVRKSCIGVASDPSVPTDLGFTHLAHSKV